ncbi:MAG TPA: hypothetical protein VLA09_01735 [Longimicrobiales bacterium]|nr:hypothetical protein [Longimicrobiales bacterium]
MKTRRLPWLPALCAASLWAATPAIGYGQEGAPSAPAGQDIVVRVTNNNWLDVHVYCSLEAGPFLSLGIVTSLTSRTFTVPAMRTRAAASLRLKADPIGGSGVYVSPRVLVGPSSEVVLTVQNSLRRSFTSVGPRRAPS